MVREKPSTPGSSARPCDNSRLPGKKGWPVLRAASHRGDADRSQSITDEVESEGEQRDWSRLMRHKLEAGVGLSSSSSLLPPGEVSFVQIARPCQPGRDLPRETWSPPCFSCERMPLLFLSKEQVEKKGAPVSLRETNCFLQPEVAQL